MNNTVRIIYASTVVCVMSALAATNPWQVELQRRLDSAYPLIKFQGAKITNQERAYIVQQEGILAGNAGSFINVYNRVDNGNILRQTGGDGTRIIKAGEKIWLDELRVRGNDVQFHIVTAGSTDNIYHKAMVTFFFPKGTLEKASFEEVLVIISKVFVSETTAASPKTISLGQNPEQVEAALGQPGKKIVLGAKVVYVYADMKVIFQDGKVVDVQ